MRWLKSDFGRVSLVALGMLGFVTACAEAPTQPTSSSGGGSANLTAPTPKTPSAGTQLDTLRPTLEVNNATATGSVGTVTYRFEVSETLDFPQGSRTVVGDNVAQGNASTSWQVPVDLIPNLTYYWRARATNGTITTEFSNPETFVTQNKASRDGHNINDPLSTGETVGVRNGGEFVGGQGWKATARSDSIRYDLPSPLTRGILEFDVTGVEEDEPPPYDIGMKFYCMGDGSQWDFFGFRNQEWKASMEKKSGRLDGRESGAIELIHRVTLFDDNRVKTGPRSWDETQWQHIKLQWGAGNVSLWVDNDQIASESYGGEYAPPNHRIDLGCPARTETLTGVTWRNVKITPW